MAATGLDVFDKTLQTTNLWLEEIMEVHGPDRHAAWHGLSAVLRALRDRLPVELAVHLGAQLPLLVRGIYYDQWHLALTPEGGRSEKEFLAHVSENFGTARVANAREMTRTVFGVLARHVDAGQVRKVTEALPPPVRALWPQRTAPAAAETTP